MWWEWVSPISPFTFFCWGFHKDDASSPHPPDCYSPGNLLLDRCFLVVPARAGATLTLMGLPCSYSLNGNKHLLCLVLALWTLHMKARRRTLLSWSRPSKAKVNTSPEQGTAAWCCCLVCLGAIVVGLFALLNRFLSFPQGLYVSAAMVCM